MDTKILDLGDFLPERYKLVFSINGHKYEFEYEEASVDDVLRMLFDGEESKNIMDKQRTVVVEFLCKHTKDDGKQLREDLATVPYLSTRGGLSISQLYQELQNRYSKKNSNGAA